MGIRAFRKAHGFLLISLFFSFFRTENASAYIELNTFYMNESMNTGATESSSRMFIDGSIGVSVDRKGHYLIGWNYSLSNVTQSTTTSTTYSSSQMGPRFIWFFTRSKSWSLGLTYNILTTANYTAESSSAEKWTGMAIKADLGYNFELSEKAYLGIKLNYSTASYNSKLVDSTDYSTISNNASFIYPSLSFVYFIW